MRSLSVGVAIGEDIFAASWSSSEWSVPLSAGPTLEAIREASAEVSQLIGAKKCVSASVAILPPLIRVRRIDLPRMSEDDYRLAVATNAQRYFLGFGQAPVCGVTRIGRRKRGSGVPLLASGASSDLIDSITSGLASVGWMIERIVPAQAAWASEILRRHPSSRRGSASIAVRLPREINVVELKDGSISRVRRLRIGDAVKPVDPSRPQCLISTGEQDQSAAISAAATARFARRFEIEPDSSRRARTARARRVTRLFVMLACANFLVAAIAYRWRLERQLSQVAAQRSAIHEPASRAIASRDSTSRLVERITAMAELERSAPRWSAVLSRIVIALPADAELSAIRAESDSLMLDGQAVDISHVLSSLRRMPGVRSTKVIAPIVHDLSADDSALERWNIAARVDHRGAARP